MLFCSLKPGTLDLLVLPEMCRSGYIFTSARAMLPYLEDQADGPTGQLAIQLAKRLRCHVIAGYPEKYVPPGAPRTPTQVTVPVDGSGIGYTSALVVGPRGDVIGNYRKSSLFEMDKCWAREGEGSSSISAQYNNGGNPFRDCGSMIMSSLQVGIVRRLTRESREWLHVL